MNYWVSLRNQISRKKKGPTCYKSKITIILVFKLMNLIKYNIILPKSTNLLPWYKWHSIMEINVPQVLFAWCSHVLYIYLVTKSLFTYFLIPKDILHQLPTIHALYIMCSDFQFVLVISILVPYIGLIISILRQIFIYLKNEIDNFNFIFQNFNSSRLSMQSTSCIMYL
jgi:hypothetical protein